MTQPEQNQQIRTESDLPDFEALKADFIEKARTDARVEAMAYVAEVHDLCALAGVPDKASSFIVKGIAADDVRRELLETKVSASESSEIAGHIPTPNTAAHASIDTAAIYAKRNNPKGE